ncbi:argininosuccinate lyase [Roseomonas sp. GCM10028921]
MTTSLHDHTQDVEAARGSSKVSGFLKESLARGIIDGVVGPRLKRTFADALRWFPVINRAHLIMLVEQGLIEPAIAGQLLVHIAALEAEGPAAFELDPEREDPWFNYEAELTRRAGAEAGRLHVARSRNDLKCTQDRLRARELGEGLLRGCLDLRQALLNRVCAEADTIMPGYTHLQHAQPMTFGWYLLGVEAALARDASRIEDALRRMDECPLGAGAFAGTRHPICRERTAKLLGFSRAQRHPLDSVANPDAVIELASVGTQLSMTIGRLGQDFYLWSTYEFGMLEFPDRVASTSSIMPQKKNLTVLENLKARPAALLGAMVTGITALRAVPFGHSQEVSLEAGRWLWEALEELRAMLPAASTMVECATPRRDRMRGLVSENFATATAVADLLSSTYGLPFREAHHVTGRYVRLAMEGADPETALRTAYTEETGRFLDDIAPLLAEALDPACMLEATTGCGPSRAETIRLYEDAQSRLRTDQETAAGRHEDRKSATHALATACKDLTSAASAARST